MTDPRRVRRALDDLGDLLGRHDEGVDLEAFEPYRDRPVAFAREVLGEDPWEAQREALELLVDRDRVAWQAGQAVGKSRTIPAAALWWAYARRGQVLVSAPTRRTVEEVVMRKELARMWHRNPRLGGDLYTGSLRIERDEPAILAYTATSASAATGQHDPEGGVLAILDEAQGVPPEVWEAMDANTTGGSDRQFVCGNPLDPSGPFYEVTRRGSGWAKVRTSALDHPNLDPESDREVPGGPSEAWLGRMRQRWGEDSPQWVARVLGRFPETSRDALVEVAWLDRARERHREGAFAEDVEGEYGVVAVDPARFGRDRTVVCVRRGRRVVAFESWRDADTAESARRALAAVRRHHEGGDGPVERVVVDAVGIGAGVADALRERLPGLEWTEASRGGRRTRRRTPDLLEFNGGSRARDPSRFADLRSQAAWALRERLEEGRLALPDVEALRRELLATRLEVTADGRTRLEPKDRTKGRLGGASPDHADALCMTLLPELREEAEMEVVWT